MERTIIDVFKPQKHRWSHFIGVQKNVAVTASWTYTHFLVYILCKIFKNLFKHSSFVKSQALHLKKFTEQLANVKNVTNKSFAV